MAQFTEQAIMDAFVRLLDRLPLDKITVQSIVNECKISRNTFYYHYGDIYALLEAVFKKEIDDFKAHHQPDDTWYEDLRRVFTLFTKHRRQIYNIYHSTNHTLLTQCLFQATEDLFLEYVRDAAEGLDASEKDLRFLCFCYQSMFVGMLLDWLRRGMKGDLVDFLDRAQRLLLGNTRRMLEANAEQKTEEN